MAVARAISSLISILVWSVSTGVLAQYPIPAHETAEQLVERGNAYIRLGNAEGAIAMFRAAIAKNPNLAIAHYNLGSALAQSGQTQPAIYAFERVVNLQPRFAIAYSNLGALQTAIQLEPKLATAHYNLGLVYREQQQYDQAIKSLNRALELDPQSATIHYHLAFVLQAKGNFPKS
ncbi:MAG: tetratricopeptide repeat protein [Pseudanabaenaceae cyanobacterium]